MVGQLRLRNRVWNPSGDEGVDQRSAGILVVDDEPAVLATMVAALEAEGFLALGSTDPRDVRKLMETVVFDVLVSDVMMPHLDGLALLEIARRQNPDVEVLLVTGYGTREVAFQAWRQGACGFLEKPFQPDQFVTAVRQALWRARMKTAAAAGG
jgi:DNA-binding NtrC family response regulator